MPEHLERIQQKRRHYDDEGQRIDVGRYAQTRAVEKAQQAQGPDDAEYRGQFHQVLLRQVVAWIELEDEHVVDAGWAPAVDVDADQKEELDDEEGASVQPEGDLQVIAAVVEYGCVKLMEVFCFWNTDEVKIELRRA